MPVGSHEMTLDEIMEKVLDAKDEIGKRRGAILAHELAQSGAERAARAEHQDAALKSSIDSYDDVPKVQVSVCVVPKEQGGRFKVKQVCSAVQIARML